MNNELIHYGVPGMKWGVRKASKKEIKSDARTYYSLHRATTDSLKKMDKAVNKNKKGRYQDEAWENSNKLLDFEKSLITNKGKDHADRVLKEWDKLRKRENTTKAVVSGVTTAATIAALNVIGAISIKHLRSR